ncbi:MAG: acyl carrier protein [Desulfobacterales bacterium]|nr:acyl carrier protein [Desulfobacterales bacterium]
MRLEDRVIMVILENSEGLDGMTVDSDLRNFGIDSFGSLMIANGLEAEFGIEISDLHTNRITSVKEIVSLLKTFYSVEETYESI